MSHKPFHKDGKKSGTTYKKTKVKTKAQVTKEYKAKKDKINQTIADYDAKKAIKDQKETQNSKASKDKVSKIKEKSKVKSGKQMDKYAEKQGKNKRNKN